MAMTEAGKKYHLIRREDPGYPQLLRQIYCPPEILYVRGTLLPDEACIAIVGARKATAGGLMMAQDLAEGLARCGITVVSGLARGIDSIAHKAAIEAGGRTIAVTGCGLDIVYPAEHLRLAQSIMEHGCLLSEFFTLIPSDVARPVASPGWSGSWAQSQQVYGRINVNTAPFEVLKRLPYPATIVHPVTGAALTVDPSVAAAYIQAYRDRTALPGTRDYSARRADPNGARVAGLRAGSDVACILTPDEVAVPLADYANHLMGWDNYTAAAPSGPSGPLDQYARYVLARDAIWRPISNLITVNTDVAIANVCVQLGTPTASQPQGKARWYYIIALDRSNCVTPADLPAVILFSEVK